MSIKDPRLLEKIRAGLRRGLDIAAASRAAGTTDDAGRGLIRRHGRSDPPPATPQATPEIAGSPRDGGCCFPLNDARPWRFCDAPRQPGHSYCPEHVRRASIRPGTRSDRPFVLQAWPT